MRACWKCKRKYDLKGMDDANFCPYCGANQMVTADLIDAAINKDQDAMAQLYMMAQGVVYTTVRSIVKDEQNTEDIVQDTYVSAFQKLGDLENPSSFYGWIKTTARNNAIGFLRKSNKWIPFSELDGDDEDKDFDVEDENAEVPGISFEEQETKTLVNEMLSGIKDDIRIPLIMYYYDDMGVKEIASELGVTESTIKNRLYYGRKQLKTKADEMEKKGISLRGLAPIPFLLMLLKNLEVHAAAAAPSAETLTAISSAFGTVGTATATAVSSSTASNTVANAAKATTSATAKSTVKVGASNAAKTTAKTTAKTAAKKGIHTVQGKLIAGAVATATVAGTGAAVYYNMTTINPMDYMIVTFEGDDGEGEASVSFDYEAFEGYRYKKEKTKEDQENTYTMEVILRNTLEYSLNRDIHLSNGEKVTLKINYDKDALSDFGYTLSGWKSSRYVVEGLTTYTYPTSFDDLSEEQIERFKEIALAEREEYYANMEAQFPIVQNENIRIIGMSMKYDESLNTTSIYFIFAGTSYTTDGQMDPIERL